MGTEYYRLGFYVKKISEVVIEIFMPILSGHTYFSSTRLGQCLNSRCRLELVMSISSSLHEREEIGGKKKTRARK